MYLLGFIFGVVLLTLLTTILDFIIKNKKHKMIDEELEYDFDNIKHDFIRSISCYGEEEIIYYCMCEVRHFNGSIEDIQNLYNKVLEYLDNWKEERKEYWEKQDHLQDHLKKLKEIRKHLDKRRKRR